MKLTYNSLATLGYEGYLLPDAPERILQFGSGAFLRGFADAFVDIANEKCGFHAKIVVALSTGSDTADKIQAQQGLYTLCLRGLEKGNIVDDRRIISAISRAFSMQDNFSALLDCADNPDLRYIISNTTEAGIVYDESCRFEDAPPSAFPAKLTRFLYARWQRGGKGFILLPCELIDNNAAVLREYVLRYAALWQLEADFALWVSGENIWCNTLVDRIVTGKPAEGALSLPYEDELCDVGEPFALWAIEGDESLAEELPFAKAGLPVKIVRDYRPYKQQKVRILNGAHTSLVLAAHLSGKTIVRECMQDEIMHSFLQKMLAEEILPTLSLPRAEIETFAASVQERFANPYIDHRLLSIALHSTAKWRARILPTLQDFYSKYRKLPQRLVFSFAAYAAFYQTGIAEDEPEVLAFFRRQEGESDKDLVWALCSEGPFQNAQLAEMPGFIDMAAEYLTDIHKYGAYEMLRRLA